jgi:hypothetical protein
MKESTVAFRCFVESHFELGLWAKRQRDGARRHPQVSAAYVFEALVHQAVLCLRSLLSLDLWLRAPHAAKLLPRAGKRRGSDSTFLRALARWKLSATRQASYALQRELRAKGWLDRRLGTGRVVRLAVVDGSCFGGFWACALGLAGALWQSLDIEPYAVRGKELPAARALLDRAVRQLGLGFATHLLYDGLMAVKKDFARARLRWGLHLVVKTTEQTLEPAASSRAAWSGCREAQLRALGVEVTRGVDAERGVSYVVCAQAGIEWDALAWPLKVAWVRETPLKGQRCGQTEEFWVLTTDESLCAEELREMAHLRWAIENHGFKALNAAVGSKRAYLKNAHAREALLLVWGIGLTLANAFGWWLEQQRGGRGWGLKSTRRWLAWLVEWSAMSDEIERRGGSP